MNRRNWLWSSLLALPVLAVGVVSAYSQARSYTCPLTGEELPCPNCCPLSKSNQPHKDAPVICPITGEELRCEKCCPLNDSK